MEKDPKDMQLGEIIELLMLSARIYTEERIDIINHIRPHEQMDTGALKRAKDAYKTRNYPLIEALNTGNYKK